MGDIKMSRKDFNGLRAKNYYERRQKTELKNIEASKRIIAAKQLRREEEDNMFNNETIRSAKLDLAQKKVSKNEILKVLDSRISEMDRRIAMFESKEEEGALKKGEQRRMALYIEERNRLIEQKNAYKQGEKKVTIIDAFESEEKINVQIAKEEQSSINKEDQPSAIDNYK